MKDNLEILTAVNNALGYLDCDDCMCSDCALYYKDTCIAGLIEDAYRDAMDQATIEMLLKKYNVLLKSKEVKNE